MTRAYEIGAAWTSAVVTIKLGDSSTNHHAMNRGDVDTYIPQYVDDRSSSTYIKIKTTSGV